jgi:hypothetical protein
MDQGEDRHGKGDQQRLSDALADAHGLFLPAPLVATLSKNVMTTPSMKGRTCDTPNEAS